jgi:hypothetical protein
LAGEAKSYAERLFQFPTIGQLSWNEAADALIKPAEPLAVTYTSDAVDAIIEYTQGYPYFLQEYGKIVWDYAADTRITLDHVRESKTPLRPSWTRVSSGCERTGLPSWSSSTCAQWPSSAQSLSSPRTSRDSWVGRLSNSDQHGHG